MIAQTPPMGWNSWDCYGAAVTEETVRANAEYLAKHLKQFGWEYVVVDIQWYQPTAMSHAYEPFSQLAMDEYGRLLPAENRFPSAANGQGFKPLADFVHSLGLKFGIHIMRGLPRMAAHRRLPILNSESLCSQAADPNSICAWNPDMYGLKSEDPAAKAYYDSIFRLYAQWGVDFVKCDDIAREYPHCKREIELISEACRHCGRDMVLSLSPGPALLEQAEHLKKFANMWRITDDFWDDWRLLKAMFERAEKWCVHAGPGHWPDADMLPLGALRQCYGKQDWTRFTPAEQRTMMTLWCMMRSPLMMGGDLPKNDDFTLSLLTNAPLLAIQKESWCAHPVATTEDASLWIAPRKDGNGCYAAAFNLSDETRVLAVPPEALEGVGGKATELWTNQETALPLSAALSPHDAAVWLVER
ncbi:MAG: glycoside hydrolase family 27 protein [Clostridia bacterium]|nr:glycoside hydrolase family 27 protein [Clostridia bacterium]MBR0219709.1 glycoside hydrolase family 27 protein [Clostridia bacterium]